MLPRVLDTVDVAVVRDGPVVEGVDEADVGTAVGATAAPAAPGGGVGAGGPAGEPALSTRELAVLALERRRYRNQGAKEQAVRDELDLSATRYYQVLNALLDDPAALAHDPVLVGRLRRLRDARTADAPR